MIKYFHNQTELKNIQPIKLAQFKALGGIPSKHNRQYGNVFGIVGLPKDGPHAFFPVTRTINYKDRPSLHKCDARCLNAKGHNCECSCGGVNHGAGS